MDSCRFCVTRAGISYTPSQLTPPTVSDRLFTSTKFSKRNSRFSPFSTSLEFDTATTLSDNLEKQSSTNNLSQVNASYNSSIETKGYYYLSSPSSLDTLQENSVDSSVNKNREQSVRHALMQLETTLMRSDSEEREVAQVSIQSTRIQNRDHQSSHAKRPESLPASSRESGFQSNPSGNLKQQLVECARALYENRLDDFEKLVKEAQRAVSISGDPIQRLGAYMVEGLVARKESSGTKIYRSLRCKEPLGKDLLSYMQILYEICPYLKFGYMAANGAIAEACRKENKIHIIDFQIAQGTQWRTLLQALSSRPGGPPHVRITGIDDPVSMYARGSGLETVGKLLAAISDKFKIQVEFHPMPVFAPQVSRDMLQLRPGEALAVNFPLQLHHTPDESVDVENPRDGLLRMVKSLSPKVTTVVEQESNTNTTPFFTRFIETLDYYSAIFESIDVTMARDCKERINAEQHCLARDIVNIIACEGKERVERHELLGKWRSRFMMAGFRPYPLSSYVNSVIRGLLKRYSDDYTLVEKDGALLLGWKNRMLVSASAWH